MSVQSAIRKTPQGVIEVSTDLIHWEPAKLKPWWRRRLDRFTAGLLAAGVGVCLRVGADGIAAWAGMVAVAFVAVLLMEPRDEWSRWERP